MKKGNLESLKSKLFKENVMSKDSMRGLLGGGAEAASDTVVTTHTPTYVNGHFYCDHSGDGPDLYYC